MNNDVNNQNLNSNEPEELLGSVAPVGVPQPEQTPSNVMPSNSQVMMDSTPTPVGTPNIEMTEPAPQTNTEPAYTNPQNIMQQPTTIFDDSNQIGQTPPVSLEEEKKPKKKPSKVLFVLFILILLAGIGYGTYYVLNHTDLLIRKDKVKISAKNVEVSVGEELPENISEYATISGTEELNCYKDVTAVDTKKEGTYKFVVTCGKVTANGSIKVVDNTDFSTLVKTVYKKKGTPIDASEFGIDDDVNYAFVDDNDSNAANNDPGTYTVKLKLTKGDKSSEVDATLVVLTSNLKGYLICSSNNQLADSTGSAPLMNVAKKAGILDDGKNSFAGFINEIYTFTFSDLTLYNEYKNKYKEEKTITINDITGKTSFGKDSESKPSIIITVEKNNETVNEEYGADNLKDFSTIMKHFVSVGLKCSYEKAE